MEPILGGVKAGRMIYPAHLIAPRHSTVLLFRASILLFIGVKRKFSREVIWGCLGVKLTLESLPSPLVESQFS